MTATTNELRHAGRRLLRAPAFTVAAALTMALAVGVNVAVFTLVYQVVIKSLPYPASERLIDLDHAAVGANVPAGVAMTTGLYYHYRHRARSLDAIALYDTQETTLTGSGEPDRIRVVRATESLVTVLQVRPARGRWFVADEDAPGGSRVAVLSHGLWTRRYGGDDTILGRTVTLDGVPTTVVGVMSPSFAFPNPDVQAWVPRQDSRRMAFDDFSFNGVARLRRGVALADARTELTSLIKLLPTLYPDVPGAAGLVDRAKLTSVARTLKDAKVGRIERVLWVLLAAVGFVLLVACANVANLYLVRSEIRQAEIAVRRALGAGRGAVASYFAAESVWISVVGGALGLGLAWAAVRLLVRYAPIGLPRLEEVSLDPTGVAYALTLIVLAAVAFTAIAIWHGAPAGQALRGLGRGDTPNRTHHRTRHVLVGAQVALALILLVASGLLGRSFQNLRAIDPGFDPSSALTFRVGLPNRDYPTHRSAVSAHEATLNRLASIPGVTRTSASTRIPLADSPRGYSSVLRVEGRPEQRIPPIVAFRAVAARYFETMGTRLIRGRAIDQADVDGRRLVAVVNEALVRAYFPNQNPIGARVRRGAGNLNVSWLTIIGVVPNTPIASLTEATAVNAAPELYLPTSISGPAEVQGLAANGPPVWVMSYVVRTSVAPMAVLPEIRRVVHSLDADLPLAQLRTLEDLVDGASAQMAFTMTLLVISAAVALILGMVGIYGALSYVVSQRTREIGVRLALGAEPNGVAAMVVRQGAAVTLAGIAVGIAAALAGSRVIRALLYDVSPRDPVIVGGMAVALFTVALVACWLPALRAARLNPVDALRSS